MIFRTARHSNHLLEPFHISTSGLSQNTALYLTHTIRGFSLSLVGIFLPLYIYGLSFSYPVFSADPVKNGIVWVLLYYLLTSASIIGVLLGLVNFIFTKLTFRVAILISLLTLAIEMCFWLLAENNISFLLYSAFLNGITTIFYWVPYHISFVRSSNVLNGNFGKSVGFRVLLITLVSGIGPLLGGVLITIYGFNVLFIVSLFLLLVSGLPIFLSMTENKHSSHNIIKILRSYMRSKKHLNSSISFFGVAVEEVVFGIFWSLLLYLTMQNFTDLGLLRSLSLIVSSLVIVFAGKYIDNHGTKKIHLVGVFFNTVFYIPRIFINIPGVLYSLELADKVNGVFYGMPLMSRLYKLGASSDLSDFILYREFVLHVSKTLITLVLLSFVFYFSWRLVFLLGMLGSALSYFIEFDLES